MREIKYYEKTLKLLEKLKKKYPSYNMGKHIATAFAEYTDIWGISDQLFFNLLQKYVTELELDSYHEESEIQNIINDGLHLSSFLEDEEEED
jgi:hypothetical protein